MTNTEATTDTEATTTEIAAAIRSGRIICNQGHSRSRRFSFTQRGVVSCVGCGALYTLATIVSRVNSGQVRESYTGGGGLAFGTTTAAWRLRGAAQ